MHIAVVLVCTCMLEVSHSPTTGQADETDSTRASISIQESSSKDHGARSRYPQWSCPASYVISGRCTSETDGRIQVVARKEEVGRGGCRE